MKNIYICNDSETYENKSLKSDMHASIVPLKCILPGIVKTIELVGMLIRAPHIIWLTLPWIFFAIINSLKTSKFTAQRTENMMGTISMLIYLNM